MNKSETIKELAGALAKAQAEMQPAPMTSKNPFLNNRYADLGSIIQTARPVLAKYGLAISQLVTGTDTIGVTTILMHSSGEWIESTVSMPTGEERGKSQAQVAGSIITYLRRYSLAAVLGMYADEDADGNAPQKQPVKPPVSAPAENAPDDEKPETVTNAENVVNSKGVRYGDHPTDKLVYVISGINKALVKDGITDEETAELKAKRTAAETIIAWRNTRADANLAKL